MKVEFEVQDVCGLRLETISRTVVDLPTGKDSLRSAAVGAGGGVESRERPTCMRIALMVSICARRWQGDELEVLRKV